ncbi:hypothetical protein NL418_022435 [Escherichia coli]|nr:hypothetical protein [Escherichia coli]WCQ56160.1 hypothetical protein NL418_022435 [Escherichia coli]
MPPPDSDPSLFPCSGHDVLDTPDPSLMAVTVPDEIVYILRPVKGNTINCVGICQPVRGNGGAVRWQGIRRPVYRFP